ncbi:MAG: YicC family protein [Candidatus Omnitrophica bacterium]|nr:YicC family protein [Candidatus Omnitrophota bacterium]
MIRGMTGFGITQVAIKELKALVEIRSLNHRYFDINCYLPSGFSSIEDKIRQIAQKQIKRGRVTVSIKITQKPPPTISFNKQVVQSYINESKKLQKVFKLNNDLSLSDIIRFPGVVETQEIFVKGESVWPVLEKAINKVLMSLMRMRTREGRSLARDVKGQLGRMLLKTNNIKKRIHVIRKENKKMLTPDEFYSFQKSSDINEEISRLIHYIEELKLLLNSESAVGKKIDFIAQEMQRETNTIGSKVQDNLISDAVIALKSKIEKIREQSQNIE